MIQMTEQTDESTSHTKTLQNLLGENPRLGEGISWLLTRGNGLLSCRKFRVVTGVEPQRLKEKGLVSINKGGSPMMYINRNANERLRVTEDTMDVVNQYLLESLLELKEAGYTIPVEMETEKLVFRLDEKSDWLSEINAQVWSGGTEKARRVDEARFGYPLIVRQGRTLSLTEKGKDACKKLDVLAEYDPRIAQRFNEAQYIGIYTALNKENESFFSWIYPKLRENGLTTQQMARVLLAVEESLRKGEVRQDEVDEAISSVSGKQKVEDEEEA